MVREIRLVQVLALVALLLTVGSLFAQSGATGTILGTVTDSTGAIVPNGGSQGLPKGRDFRLYVDR